MLFDRPTSPYRGEGCQTVAGVWLRAVTRRSGRGRTGRGRWCRAEDLPRRPVRQALDVRQRLAVQIANALEDRPHVHMPLV
jgi:hypothetical protein